MFYINYDLAKQIAEERRSRALAASALRKIRKSHVVSRREQNADVIELAFGARCDVDRIGA